jgi:hypothetical protein
VATKLDIPDPVLLGDGTVMVFAENSELPDGYETHQVGPGDDDYAYWVGQAQAAAKMPTTPSKRRWGRTATVAAGVAIAILVLLWRAGTFDHALVNVGLNAKECARNGFGATFCGKELTEYRERQTRA